MILSIASSIRHRLEYLNDYFVEDDDVDGILVVRNYLSTVLADNPLASVYLDPVVDSFVILTAASIKTLTAPTIFNRKIYQLMNKTVGIFIFISSYPV